MALLKRGPLKGREAETVGRQEPLRKAFLDEHGRLKPDPMPLEPPIGYKRTPPLAETIRAMVRGEALAHAARNSGAETFEEADDFDVPDDDYDPRAPFEEVFDPPPTWEDQAEKLGVYIERGRRKAEQHFAEEDERMKKKAEKLREKADQESEAVTPTEADAKD